MRQGLWVGGRRGGRRGKGFVVVDAEDLGLFRRYWRWTTSLLIIIMHINLIPFAARLAGLAIHALDAWLLAG